VLRLGEVPAHPHIAARRTMVTHEGVVRPAAAPRFSRTPAGLPPTTGDGAAATGWGVG
jgi:alpha-methylacyl-CoA racemase